MRRSGEFAETIRSGTRSAGRYLVVHVFRAPDPTPADKARVGFVVSRAVGGAVQRNRVRRRLRAVMAPISTGLPDDARVVVRARPPAARATFQELQQDVHSQMARAMRRAGAGSWS